MVDVHVVAPTILTQAVLPGMIERNSGGIINVSSLSAWFHSAGNVQYGSTKNYLAVFSRSLHQELRGTNVRVQALCPGFVRTEFHAAQSMQAFNLRRCSVGAIVDVSRRSRRLLSAQVERQASDCHSRFRIPHPGPFGANAVAAAVDAVDHARAAFGARALRSLLEHCPESIVGELKQA